MHGRQCYNNTNTSQGNLQIQCNPYQNFNDDFLHKLKKKSTLKFIRNLKGPQVAKTVINIRILTFPRFKT